MQTALTSQSVDGKLALQVGQLRLRVDVVVYTALLVLVLALRLAELDTVFLGTLELRPAIASAQVVLPGYENIQRLTTNSPIVFSAQILTYSVLGVSEFTSRLLTALAGAALVFSPLLFQRLIGRGRTLLFVLLLAASPVLLMASRSASPVIWSALLAVLGLWAAWHFVRTELPGYAVLASLLFGAVVFLTEPAGWLLVVQLVAAGFLTLRGADEEVEEIDLNDPDSKPRRILLKLQAWPWVNGLVGVLLLVLAVSTGFFFYRDGMANVAEVVGGAVGGFTTAAPGTPLIAPVLTSLFYEPAWWLLSLLVVVLVQNQVADRYDRFFITWAMVALIASLLYRGANPAHALWLTLPLSGLAARIVFAALQRQALLPWEIPDWARWLVAIAVIGVLCVASLGAQRVGNELFKFDGATGTVFDHIDLIGAILLVIALLFAIVVVLMAGSSWNPETVWNGALIGVFIFGAVTSMGAGWRAVTLFSTNATELWHLQTTSDDYGVLRDLLTDLTRRESRGETSVRVSALAPRDGVIAWLLRDYSRVTWINQVSEARGAGVVLLPPTSIDQSDPDLGAAYIGHILYLQRSWSLSGLRGQDFLSWWLNRQGIQRGVPVDGYTLWLRQDIYNGDSPGLDLDE